MISSFNRKALTIVLLISSFDTSFAQSRADKKAIHQLKQDINYLASDELEGRATATVGEKKAGDYIISVYQRAGIQPYMGKYRYDFNYSAGKEIAPATRIKINGSFLKYPDEAFPLPFTGDKKVTAELLPEVMEQGNAWLLPLYESEDQANDPHFNWEKHVYEKAKEAAKMGALAVVFFDGYGSKYPPAFNAKSEYEQLDIPCAIMLYSSYHTIFQNATLDQVNNADIPIELNLRVKTTERTGTNIAAYIENGAKYTVVLGAHYDHLGYGDESGLYRGKEKMIHNGADDNASGTAALLQLAARIKKEKLSTYNYLFVNFSGEELGLLGSKAFVKQQKLDGEKVAYMINMDMVGRLDEDTHTITVGGVGTSPEWSRFVGNDVTDFKISIDSSGVGPSDHTSFYNAGIPVLFLFTGSHNDYHKPSDDADKINYAGEVLVMNYIMNVVKGMEGHPKPAFMKTKNTNIGKVDFKVTLGIIPDYSYQTGDGLRIDGVSEGKTAYNAGLKASDIITRMGDVKVNGIMTYMEALGHFNHGDSTVVTVLRDKKEMKFTVVFQ